MWIWEKIKPVLSRFIPQHVNDPFGLIGRMLSSSNRAALFTLLLTALGILLTPLDWLLQFYERRYKKPDSRVVNTSDVGPHLFICGPARSGTTLVYQVLANALPVVYPRNFTALFSRSPILASKLLTRTTSRHSGYENFYGKTYGMQAPSEANHLWNQWVLPDESHFRTRLEEQGLEKMASFFTRLSAEFGRPTITKNNNANAFADVIAGALENAYFICLRRDSRYLAQSLIRAREVINGDIEQSYGVVDAQSHNDENDPVSQVIAQIEYLNQTALTQQKKIGAERFWIVDYESFCADPNQLIERIRSEIPGMAEVRGAGNHAPDTHDSNADAAEKNSSESMPLAAIKNNNRISDPDLFKQLEERLGYASDRS
jgi:hypothetical protein